MPEREKRHRNHQLIFGLLIIFFGVMLLAKKIGLFFVNLHFWPIMFIAIGLYSGAKHRFQNFTSWALIILGLLLMIPRFIVWGVLSTHLVGPILLILLGTFLIIKPGNYRFRRAAWKRTASADTDFSSDKCNIESSFAEQKVAINSKDFTEGKADANFSELTINMMDTTISNTATLHIRANFSSVVLLAPAEWKILLESDNNGSKVEDRRWISGEIINDQKCLTIYGKYNFSEMIIKSK